MAGTERLLIGVGRSRTQQDQVEVSIEVATRGKEVLPEAADLQSAGRAQHLDSLSFSPRNRPAFMNGVLQGTV